MRYILVKLADYHDRWYLDSKKSRNPIQSFYPKKLKR